MLETLVTFLIVMVVFKAITGAVRSSQAPPPGTPRGYSGNNWPRTGLPRTGFPRTDWPDIDHEPMGQQTADDFEGRQAPGDSEGQSMEDTGPGLPPAGAMPDDVRPTLDVAPAGSVSAGAVDITGAGVTADLAGLVGNQRARGTAPGDTQALLEPAPAGDALLITQGDVVRAVVGAELLGRPRAARPWRPLGR